MRAARELKGIPERFWLRWKQQEEGPVTFAYRGENIVGMVGPMIGGGWFYKLDAVSTRGLTKGTGRVKSKRSATRAVDRAWRDWLGAMELF